MTRLAEHTVDVPGRGTAVIWDNERESDRPPLLLLHGWNVDAPLTFGAVLPTLGASHRTIMFDHHGHGHGVRAPERFRLEDCAADVIRIADELGLDEFVPVGYSMGGLIAQLVALRGPDRVAGLVLASTAHRFSVRCRERAEFGALGTASKAMPRLSDRARAKAFRGIAGAICRPLPESVLESVMLADPAKLLEAGHAIGQFDSRGFLHAIHTHTVVVLSANDQIIPVERQQELARLLDADVVRTEHNHHAPIFEQESFARALLAGVDQLG
ncbi:MAG: alpha/beta hydrolase [Acidimicrobiales bacterium]|nr:alpha/beta hydrolase [Acidimicrobiales bacterium]RZV46448.1 MAG: alpha/beta hydrolase [Acidimicrobiales bacterium]